MQGACQDTYGNHESHDNPPFYVEEREWTILGFLLRYAMSMFLVKFMKYQTKEYQKYYGSFTDFEEPIMRIVYPATYSNT